MLYTAIVDILITPSITNYKLTREIPSLNPNSYHKLVSATASMHERLKSIQFHQSRNSAQPEGEHKMVLVKIYSSLDGSPRPHPLPHQ